MAQNVVEFSIRAKDEFSRSMGTVSGALVAVTGAATATGAALFALAKHEADLQEKTGLVAQRLGLATQALSELHFQAELSGVAAGTLDMALQRMTRRVAEAAGGTGEAVGALRELGLSASNLNKQAPDRILLAVADAMQEVEDQGDRVRLAFKLLDSEGVAVLQTMDKGSEGFRQAAEDLRELGAVITAEGAQRAAEFNTELAKMNAALVGTRRELADGTIPFFTDLFSTLVSLRKAWIDARDSLISFRNSVVDVIAAINPFIDPALAKSFDPLTQAVTDLALDWDDVADATEAAGLPLLGITDGYVALTSEVLHANNVLERNVEILDRLTDGYAVMGDAAARAAFEMAQAAEAMADLETFGSEEGGGGGGGGGMADIAEEIGLSVVAMQQIVSLLSQIGPTTGGGVQGAIAGFQMGGPWGAAIGAGAGVLLADPEMKEAMAELDAALGDLIGPIAKELAPWIRVLAEILHELQPVAIAIGAQLRFLNNSIDHLRDTVQPLGDTLEDLRDDLHDLPGAIGDAVRAALSGIGGSSTGSRIGRLIAGGTSGIGGFDEGGVITPDRMFQLPGMAAGEGLIKAHAGETVVPAGRTAQAPLIGEVHFNEGDPHALMAALRDMLGELRATGRA